MASPGKQPAPDPAAILGRRLREARLRAGLDLRDAAARAGISAVSLQKYETARMTPTVHRLAALAGEYGCTTDELLDRAPPEGRIAAGRVLVDRAKVEAILAAERPEDLVPHLNWRPGMYLALVEVPEAYAILGAGEAIDLALELRDHVSRIAPGLVEAYEEHLRDWEDFRKAEQGGSTPRRDRSDRKG